MKIDVIIPTYKPGKELFTLLERLNRQTVAVRDIILMNTEEKYFEPLLIGNRLPIHRENIHLYHLSRKEFDHGGTRRTAVKKTDADVFVMMTQDAMPEDEHLIENLVAPLGQADRQEEGAVAVSYARQLPAPDCGVIESYTRSFNYPEESCIKSVADLDRLGIKTFFCSNVCAAYRRDIYEKLGGFVKHTIFNEDMIYAAMAIKAGYSVAYAADARVIHSHNYTNGQQFHRNFDLAVSQADHPEVFSEVPSEKEGLRMVRKVCSYLRESGQLRLLPHFIMQSFCKYAGYFLGKRYHRLPLRLVLACSDNKEYWRQERWRKYSKEMS